MRLIDADTLLEVISGYCDDREGLEEYIEESILQSHELYDLGYQEGYKDAKMPTVELVRHGKWLIEAHKENANYRWNVTACCSECAYDLGEIWAGFFPGIPDGIAENVCFNSAKSVDVGNYCPNCGAKMG